MELVLTAHDLLETVRAHIAREEQMELDSTYLVTHLDQLRQASERIKKALVEWPSDPVLAMRHIEDALVIIDTQRVRIGKDALDLQKSEQYDESPVKAAF